MLRRSLARVTFSNVMSMMAVFIALGGSAYAATLAKNSVGAKQIKKNAVGASEIKRDAVRSAEVRNRSLLAVDFKAGQLPAGAKGDKGDKGDKGATGATGAYGAITVQRTDVALPDATSASAEASCLPGTKAIGGGATTADSGATDIHMTVSRPGTSAFLPNDGESFDSWRVVFVNVAGGTAATTIRAFAICAEAPTPAP